MSDTKNTQNQLSNIEAGQIELLTERIISNKPSDAEIIYNKRKKVSLYNLGRPFSIQLLFL